MHLAYLAPFGADVRSWSGIPYHMSRALAAHVETLSVVDGLDQGPLWRRAVLKLVARAKGRPLNLYHTEAVAKRLAESASRAVRRLRPDAVLCPSSLPLARCDIDCPVSFWTDATFESSLLFYADYSGLPEWNVREGHQMEQAALARADLAVYASAYAADSAVHYYGADPGRVAVVPFGANWGAPPDRGAVLAAAARRPSSSCTLLFLGVDWVRKGGDVAVLVADALNAMGLPTELHVVGCRPLLDRPRPYVHVHGFVSKADAEGRRALDRLLAAAHFLIMPVRAEAFGCVFCEASGFAVPSLTARAGGTPTAVEDGVNGFVFPARPDPARIAARIASLLRDPGAYLDLCRSSRDRYERELNWDAAVGRVVGRLAALT